MLRNASTYQLSARPAVSSYWHVYSPLTPLESMMMLVEFSLRRKLIVDITVSSTTGRGFMGLRESIDAFAC